MEKLFKNILTIVLLSAVLAPNLAMAQSTSFNVSQPVCDVEPCAPSGGGDGGSNGTPQDTSSPTIFDVAVKATFNSATISWSTNEISLGKVSWGKNTDYGDGEISKEQYSKLHSAEILNLLPQTQYYFRIIAFDQAGNNRYYTGKLLTLVQPDTKAPENVSNFAVQTAQDRIGLSWQNPVDADFELVRVVRSTNFYPADPTNGLVIYEGNADFVKDFSVSPGISYFYSIFAKDLNGNYSTGAIGAGRILWYSEAEVFPLESPDPAAPVVDITFPPASGSTNNPASIEDFDIRYNNGSVSVNINNPIIPAGTDTRIVVPSAELPVGARYLTLTVYDADTGVEDGNYLFSYDTLTKEWFVTVPALIAEKLYKFVITIYNSAHQVLQEIVKYVKIASVSANATSLEPSVESFPVAAPIIIVGVLIGLTIFGRYYSLRRLVPQPEIKIRRRKKQA